MDITSIAANTKNYASLLEQERSIRRQYFNRLKKAKAEYNELNDGSVSFDHWLRKTYGVEMEYDVSGDILGYYSIVCDVKHTLFLLKFS